MVCTCLPAADSGEWLPALINPHSHDLRLASAVHADEAPRRTFYDAA